MNLLSRSEFLEAGQRRQRTDIRQEQVLVSVERGRNRVEEQRSVLARR